MNIAHPTFCYLTSVKQPESRSEPAKVRHIVSVVNVGNVEVIESVHPYKDTKCYNFDGITVHHDFKIQHSGEKHLAKLVYAVELVRFVVSHLEVSK